MNTELLDQGGVDYAACLERCLGNNKLCERVLSAFVKDDLLPGARGAFDRRDMDALGFIAHFVKGSAGNMGLNSVYAPACELDELLRGGIYTESELASAFYALEAAYSSAWEAIRKALAK